MIYLTVAVLLLLLMFCIFTEKIYSPLTIFLGIWLVVCSLASMRLFDMYEYSYHAPLVILIGVVGMFLGYMIAKKYRVSVKSVKRSISTGGTQKTKVYYLREKALIILLAVAIAVYATMAVSVLALLAAGFDASTIREMYRDSGETAISGMASSVIYGSKMLKYVDSYLAKPIVLASIPIMSIELTEKGRITLLSILSMVALGLSMFVTFGRTNILIAAASIVSAFLIQRKQLPKKVKRRLIFIAVFVLLVITVFYSFMSGVRESGSNSNAIMNAYAYFAIPVPLLDYWMEHADKAGAYSLGFSYISGFVANIMNVLARFNIILEPYKSAQLYNYNLVDHFISVFPSHRYNAYVSMFFAFYLDFREFGVFFGSMIYGYIVSRIFKKAKNDKLHLALYLMLLQSLLWSFVRWHFVIVSYCFGLILLRLLFTTNEKTHFGIFRGKRVKIFVHKRRKK